MPNGIELLAPDGRVLMDGTGRYPRVIDVIDLSVVSTPGSRIYSSVDSTTLNYILYQGGGRARVVSVLGSTVAWNYANINIYRVFSGKPQLVVVSG